MAKTYGYDAVKLSSMSMDELTELQQSLTDDPANKNPHHPKTSIYLYDKKTRKKLDAIAWAITYKLQDKANGVRPITKPT